MELQYIIEFNIGLVQFVRRKIIAADFLKSVIDGLEIRYIDFGFNMAQLSYKGLFEFFFKDKSQFFLFIRKIKDIGATDIRVYDYHAVLEEIGQQKTVEAIRSYSDKMRSDSRIKIFDGGYYGFGMIVDEIEEEPKG
jgi:hypothetical protein